MAEFNEIIIKNPHAMQHLGEMFNNKKCSDVVFLVNNAQFYASSHFLTVSCKVLDSLVDTHYQICADREVRIGPVKYNESFLTVLKFIYNLDINITRMEKAVLCEALCLSERFELVHFSNKLKNFISNLDHFHVDSIVVLLNATKKFKLDCAYEKMKMFAYQNTEDLVKHETFVDLQYEILLDLLKSDWFCTLEINILTGTLNWHGDNMSTQPRRNEELGKALTVQSISSDECRVGTKKEPGHDSLQEKTRPLNSVSNNSQDFVSQQNSSTSILNLVEITNLDGTKTDTNDVPNKVENLAKSDESPEEAATHTDQTIHNNLLDKNASLFLEETKTVNSIHPNRIDENSSEQKQISAHLIAEDISCNVVKEKKEYDDGNRSEDLVCDTESNNSLVLKTFAENILKSLLSHIRISQISALQMFQVLRSDQYVKYREILSEEKNYSLDAKPRQVPNQEFKIEPLVSFGKKFCSITGTFTVKAFFIAPNNGILYESSEEYLIQQCKWKIAFKCKETKELDSLVGTPKFNYEMYLKCTSLKHLKCVAECQVKLTSSPNLTMVLPRDNSFKSVTLDNRSHVLFDTFHSVSPNIFSTNGVSTFEVVFKSISDFQEAPPSASCIEQKKECFVFKESNEKKKILKSSRRV